MFSKEMENLIEATLADGVLTDQEKAALVKRAQKEGIDLDELEIYIDSIIQKREQNRHIALENETRDHEKLREGNVCPHCKAKIPPLTKICPNCHQAVNSNETTGDKEMYILIEQITAATIKVKSSTTSSEYKVAKAECEALLKKADLFYGDNKKVQMLVFDLKNEITSVESKLSKEIRNKTFGAILKNSWFWLVLVGVFVTLFLNFTVNRINHYKSEFYSTDDRMEAISGSYGVENYEFSKGNVREFSDKELNDPDNEFDIELSEKLKKVTEEDWKKFDELRNVRHEYSSCRATWKGYRTVARIFFFAYILALIVFIVIKIKNRKK